MLIALGYFLICIHFLVINICFHFRLNARFFFGFFYIFLNIPYFKKFNTFGLDSVHAYFDITLNNSKWATGSQSFSEFLHLKRASFSFKNYFRLFNSRSEPDLILGQIYALIKLGNRFSYK